MVKLLTRGGKLVAREGIAQRIPDGVSACDCLCEGGGGCSICPDVAGGPYTSATHTHTISGFPTVWEYRPVGFNPCGLQSHKIIYTGLNQANGTWVTSTDPATCSTELKAVDFTISMEKREFNYDSFACTGTTLSSSLFSTTWNFSYGIQWGLANSFPNANNVFCGAPGTFEDGGFPCLGASGSIFVSGGGSCAGFTITWSTVVTFM